MSARRFVDQAEAQGEARDGYGGLTARKSSCAAPTAERNKNGGVQELFGLRRALSGQGVGFDVLKGM